MANRKGTSLAYATLLSISSATSRSLMPSKAGLEDVGVVLAKAWRWVVDWLESGLDLERRRQRVRCRWPAGESTSTNAPRS